MPFPNPESMKVTTREELEERLEKIDTFATKLRERHEAIKSVIGEHHKEFFDDAQERHTKLQEFKARVKAAAGNEEETKAVIDDWNSKVEERHQKFVAKIEEIKAAIEAKFPGGVAAFKAKFGEI